MLLSRAMLASALHSRWTLAIGVLLLLFWLSRILRRRRGERTQCRHVVQLLALAAAVYGLSRLFAGEGLQSTHLVFAIASGLLFATAVVKLSGIFVFAGALPLLRYEQPRIVRDLVMAGAYLTVGLLFLGRNGMSITGVLTTSAVLTAVIGFSLQDTLGNIMSGLAIQLNDTVQTGDWLGVDTHSGQVREVGWRHTAIETRDWDTVYIPNTRLMKGEFQVLGRRELQPQQRRQWVYFNVDFRTAPATVMDTVERALCKSPIENVSDNPLPNCVIMEFQESWGRYAVRYWLTDLLRDDYTNSLVRSRIFTALARANIPLSVPAHTLFLRDRDQAEMNAHEERELQRRLAALSVVEVFRSLNQEEMRKLAGRLSPTPFEPGEIVMRQGSEAHWLYLLTSGTAAVEVQDSNGARFLVNKLAPGDVFGEMSLLTGAARSATVIAETEIETYRMDAESFRDILRQRPEIGTYISDVLARRNQEMQESVQRAGGNAVLKTAPSHELLARIYSFFNLGNSRAKGI